jgi:hypothetical protein
VCEFRKIVSVEGCVHTMISHRHSFFQYLHQTSRLGIALCACALAMGILLPTGRAYAQLEKGLDLGKFPQTPSQTQQPFSETLNTMPEVLKFPDGWQLINPPHHHTIYRQTTDLFHLEVKTLPLLPVATLPKGTHPAMARLNQYDVVTFKPNAHLIQWHDAISFYETPFEHPTLPPSVGRYAYSQTFQTPHIAEQVLSRYPSLSEATHPGKKSSVSFGAIMACILLAPVILVMFLLCSPFLLQGSSPQSKQYKEENKNEALKGKLIYEHFAPFMNRITQLQQAFYLPKGQSYNKLYHLGDTQGMVVPPVKQGENQYHVLPSMNDYRLNKRQKTIQYGEVWQKWMLLDFTLVNPMPMAQLRTLFKTEGFTMTFEQVRPPTEADASVVRDKNPETATTVEDKPSLSETVSACRVAYLLPHFKTIRLSCMSL